MKRKYKQILIIWLGLLAGILLFRGGWMTYAGLAIFLLDLVLVKSTQRCPHCGRQMRELRPDKTCPYCGKKVE
jgi:DNA-directed RNA polymerase subunit RPC12/RpoP